MKQSMSSGVTEAHGSLLYCGCNESIFSLKCFAFQTIRPVVSRKKHGFSAHFGPGGAVPPPRVLPFSKLKRSIRNQRMNRPTDDTQRAFLREGYAGAFTPHAAGECVSRCLRRACKAIPENIVVYFAGERKGGTRRFPELFRLFTLRGKEPLCSAVDVRKAPASPDGHGLRPPVGSLLAAKRGSFPLKLPHPPQNPHTGSDGERWTFL